MNTFNTNDINASNLSATTISATTYYNLPVSTDIYVTGGTYTAGTSTFTNNTGGTFNVTGFTVGYTYITEDTVAGTLVFSGANSITSTVTDGIDTIQTITTPSQVETTSTNGTKIATQTITPVSMTSAIIDGANSQSIYIDNIADKNVIEVIKGTDITRIKTQDSGNNGEINMLVTDGANTSNTQQKIDFITSYVYDSNTDIADSISLDPQFLGDGTGIKSVDNTNSIYSQTTYTPSEIILSVNDEANVNATYIDMMSTSITVEGTSPTFQGVEYVSDYSANFTNRSLVDKEYVDNSIVAISITYADLSTALSTSAMTPDAVYFISDKNIWVKAISNTLLSPSGYRQQTIVKDDGYKSIGTLGVWYIDNTYSINDKVIWGGKLWLNLTGVAGTADDAASLDATNWSLITSDALYYDKIFDVEYDFINDKIKVQRDDKGNTIYYNPSMDYPGMNITDWGDNDIFHNICDGIYNNYLYYLDSASISGNIMIGGNDASCEIYNNKVYGIHNNDMGGAIWGNANSGVISHNKVRGSIYGNLNAGNIISNTNLGSIAQNTSNVTSIELNSNLGEITSNSNISNISNNSNTSYITNNSNTGSIYLNNNNGRLAQNSNIGDIMSNSNTGDIINNSGNGAIKNNSNNGNISQNEIDTALTVTDEDALLLTGILSNSNLGNIETNVLVAPDFDFACGVRFNNNNGFITSNTVGWNIATNSNIGNIDTNTNNIQNNSNTGIIGYNSSAIQNNSNNGGITSNLDGYVANNSNNGDITGNESVNVTFNSNNGNVSTNNTGPTTISYNSNDGNIQGNSNVGIIEYNSNGGDIGVNSQTSGTCDITHNNNNGNIAGARTTDVTGTIVNI